MDCTDEGFSLKAVVDDDNELCAKASLDALIKPQPSSRYFDIDRLDQCAQWLQSIPRDDIPALIQTSAYNHFLLAFEQLSQSHRQMIAMKQSLSDMIMMPESNVSFIQYSVMDDILLRVFEYLDCFSLVKMCHTCTRFKSLAIQNATQRSRDIAKSRQLDQAMKLLRAQEQIEGVGNNILTDRPVRVPMLGLLQRVLVTGTGDPEFNGIYHCTESNGNGFVFTKPRNPTCRVTTITRSTTVAGLYTGSSGINAARVNQHHLHDRFALLDERDRTTGDVLRCIIEKKFSHETILWYMSKEVEAIVYDTVTGLPTSNVSQVYFFWARLMITGDTSSQLCQYPSQSSILSRNGNPAWQPLDSTRESEAPLVELLDSQ